VMYPDPPKVPHKRAAMRLIPQSAIQQPSRNGCTWALTLCAGWPAIWLALAAMVMWQLRRIMAGV
jgi:hypothetical protein